MTYSNQPRETNRLFDDASTNLSNPQNLPEETHNLPEPVSEPSSSEATSAPAKPQVKKTKSGSMWVGLVISAILLIVLLVFILQNQQQSELNLFAWTWNFPVGVGMLFAAILGALITALVGGWRIMDLRRQIRNGN